MSKMIPARAFRGIAMARADASDPNAVLAALNTAFETFKADNDDNLKKRDVVTDEKLARMNEGMNALQAALDDLVKQAALSQVLGGGQIVDPEVAAYNQSFEAWFRRGDRAIDADLNDMAVQAKISTDSNPDGGYVVTPEMDSAIDRVLGTVSAMRGLARTISIGTDQYKKLINMGGAGSGWVGENEARPETDTPTLRELIFNVAELYANPAITQKSLDDANIDIAEWLSEEVSETFAEQEGAAFITGNGSNKPRGILGYDTVANASYAWGKLGFVKTGAAAAFATGDPTDAFVSLYYALKAGYRNGATWLLSDAVMESVRKFKDGQGNYIWAAPTGVDMPATILGKPVSTDDNMDALGANKFPVAFGNFQRAYLIVDRVGTRVLRDPFTNKPNVHFYTTKRVGGGIQNYEALKLMKVAA